MGKFVVNGDIMEPSEIKQKLHHYIDTAEDKKLQAIYTILESEIEGESFYSEEEVKMFYDRRQNHLDGNSKSYTIDEANDSIRRNRKANGL